MLDLTKELLHFLSSILIIFIIIWSSYILLSSVIDHTLISSSYAQVNTNNKRFKLNYKNCKDLKFEYYIIWIHYSTIRIQQIHQCSIPLQMSHSTIRLQNSLALLTFGTNKFGICTFEQQYTSSFGKFGQRWTCSSL